MCASPRVQSIFGGRSTRSISRQADSTFGPSTSQPRAAPHRPSQAPKSHRGCVQNGLQIRPENGAKVQSRPHTQHQSHKRDFRGMFDSGSDGEGSQRRRQPAQPVQRMASHPSVSNRRPPTQHPRSSSTLPLQQSSRDSRPHRDLIQLSKQPLNVRQGSGKVLHQAGQQRVRVCASARQASNAVRTMPSNQRPTQVLRTNVLQHGGYVGQGGLQGSSIPLRQQARPGGNARHQRPSQPTKAVQQKRQNAGKQLAGVRRDVHSVGSASRGTQQLKQHTDQNGSIRGLAVHPARRVAVAGHQPPSSQHGSRRPVQSARGATGASQSAGQRNGQHVAVQSQQAQHLRMKGSQGLFSQAKIGGKKQVRGMVSRPNGFQRRRSTEDEDDLDGFIADGDELSEDACDWRKELKKITGYDGSQFKDIDDADDPSMEVGWQRCLAEEHRSAKRGREEDAREEMLNMKRKQKK